MPRHEKTGMAVRQQKLITLVYEFITAMTQRAVQEPSSISLEQKKRALTDASPS